MREYDAAYVPASAMAIFAHPDDAEFMVAGTIARWTAAGCEVTLVLLTSGNAGTHDPRLTREKLARLREKEELASSRILGIKKVVFLRHDDCGVIPTLKLRRELVRQIRKHRPEAVICGDPQGWFFDDRYINHPDHRAAGIAALEAVFPASEMELLWPEEGTPHRVQAVYVCATPSPNTWIDINDTIDVKIEALKAHASQLDGWDPTGTIREWAGGEARKAPVIRRMGKVFSRVSRLKYAESYRVMRLRERERPPEPANNTRERSALHRPAGKKRRTKTR